MNRQDLNSKQRGAGSGWPWASLLLTALAVLAYFAPGLARAGLYYRDSGLDDAWRYLTCHWVHWTGSHLLWSGGTFLVLGALCEQLGRRRFAACVLSSALLIPIGLRLWAPELLTYGGLSGVDSALFGMLGVSVIQEAWATRKWGGAAAVVACGAGFAAKIGYELVTGATFFVQAADVMVPVPLAHVLGLAAGVGTGLAGWYADRRAPAGSGCANPI